MSVAPGYVGESGPPRGRGPLWAGPQIYLAPVQLQPVALAPANFVEQYSNYTLGGPAYWVMVDDSIGLNVGSSASDDVHAYLYGQLPDSDEWYLVDAWFSLMAPYQGPRLVMCPPTRLRLSVYNDAAANQHVVWSTLQPDPARLSGVGR